MIRLTAEEGECAIQQQRKRLCIYCDHWQNGGVEAYIMNLLRFWDFEKLPYDLAVSQMETDLYDQELKALGIKCKVTLSRTYASPILRILKNLPEMRRLFASGAYDAIYLNLSNSFTMIYAWMAKREGIPVRVVHSHCAGIQQSWTRPIKKFAHQIGQSLFGKAATHYFACSQKAAIWMFGRQRVESGDVTIIPNAVNVSRFEVTADKRAQAREKLGLVDNRVIGTVGRLTELKNIDLLIQAFAKMKENDATAKLLIVGEGELRPKLEALIVALNVQDSVILYGTTANVPEVLWAMDIFCLTSRFEGNPVSVIEAQAAGCMCLVSDQVTRQCKVSDNVVFLPIGAEHTSVWAEEMRQATRLCTPQQAALQVRENGYDAEEMSQRVQAVLQNGIERGTNTAQKETVKVKGATL